MEEEKETRIKQEKDNSMLLQVDIFPDLLPFPRTIEPYREFFCHNFHLSTCPIRTKQKATCNQAALYDFNFSKLIFYDILLFL